MANGVRLDIRHKPECPAKGRDSRNCKCGPSVGLKIHSRRVQGAVWHLPLGWRVADLGPIEQEGLRRKTDHDSGRNVVESRRVPTVEEWGEDWLAKLDDLVALGEYSPETIRSYRSTFKNHVVPAIGPLKLTQVTTSDVAALRRTMQVEKKLSPAYAIQTGTMLSGMLADAIPRFIDHNAASMPRRRGRSARPYRATGREKIMEVDFARALLATTTGDVYEQTLCGLSTGMRKMEIAGLLIEQVKFSEKVIVVENQHSVFGDRLPKGAKVRELPLCDTLARCLQMRAERITSGYVWERPDVKGQPYSAFLMTDRLNAAWEAIGDRPDRHSWHVLRHTFASLLDRERIRKVTIDAIMGHGPRDVSSVYQHMFREDMELVRQALDKTWGDVAPGQLVDMTTGQDETEVST